MKQIPMIRQKGRSAKNRQREDGERKKEIRDLPENRPEKSKIAMRDYLNSKYSRKPTPQYVCWTNL